MNAETLLAAPLRWQHAGKTYLLAEPDHELELLLQGRHEAWARNRIEATREMVPEAAYRADLEAFGERRDTNRFAFRGRLSVGWLLSDDGMAEYVLLLSQKGQKEHGGPALTAARVAGLRRDRAAWGDLVALVLGREFPNLLPPRESPSPAGGTPTPTTRGSSSCSPADPGS